MEDTPSTDIGLCDSVVIWFRSSTVVFVLYTCIVGYSFQDFHFRIKMTHLHKYLYRDEFCLIIQSYLKIFNRRHNVRNTTHVSSQSASIVDSFGNKIQT